MVLAQRGRLSPEQRVSGLLSRLQAWLPESMPDGYRPGWSVGRSREAIQGDPTYAGTYLNRYEDKAFRSLSVMDRYRDPASGDWSALLREVWEAYTNNPLAYAIIELGTDFVVGSGVHCIADDPRLQSLIDTFWNDEENGMEWRAPLLYTELSLHGELFIRFFSDPLTGRTVIRSVPPERVVQIKTDAQDIEHPVSYVLSLLDGSSREVPASDILHFKVNVLPYVQRGSSDLRTLLPWLRRYKDWLTDRVRINKYKAAFIYTVKMLGFTPEDLARKRAEYSAPPEPGTVIFHNESEEWNAVSPHIGADDVSADGRAIRLMIATGARMPEHFLSEGGQTNRATAQEMGLPTFRHFRRRQELFRLIIRRIVERAVARRNEVVGVLGPLVRQKVTFQVQFDELQELDRRAAGQMATMFANALSLAQDKGWVVESQAASLFLHFLGEEMGDLSRLLGVEPVLPQALEGRMEGHAT